MTLFPHVPPEVMTPRARAYLLATALYCLGMALGPVAAPDRYGSVSFAVVEQLIPFAGMYGWAAVHGLVAAIAARAAWTGQDKWAYHALTAAAGCVAPWAFGFWFALFTEPDASPTGVIAYTFILIVHIIQARQPIRSPFEPVLRRLRDA